MRGSVTLSVSVCTYMYNYLSVVGLSISCRSVTVCTKRAGNEGGRAESHAESERLRAGGHMHKSDRLRLRVSG